MKRIVQALVLVWIATQAVAQDIPVDVEGKPVTVRVTATNRQIVESDMGAGDQTTPLGCSLMYYGFLAKGEIAAASALSEDPQATVKRWDAYTQRLGVEALKKEMGAYFTSSNTVRSELTLGESVMLVIKTTTYTAGQIYVRQDGKWLVVEKPTKEAGKAFGKILSKIQNGEMTF